MQLLAGSLNVEVDQYLHAGYLSASPRSFDHMGSHELAGTQAKLIDVKSALELKSIGTSTGQPDQQAASQTAYRISPPGPASMVSDGLVLGILFFFFAFLISVYYRRIRKLERPGWRPWLLAVPLLMLVFLAVVVYRAVPGYEAQQLNSLPPPWADTPIKEYQDPEAATHAILHGLVVNALPGCAFEVKNLAAIQYEVAFPLRAEQHTPGMVYARRSYGRDGWGREFQIQPLAAGRYRVASAGADGVHDTKDDIFVQTPAKDRDNWEQLINGVYVRRVKGEYICFVHRVKHGKFYKAHARKAQRITGTDQFDVFEFDRLWRFHPQEEQHPLLAQLEEHQQSRQFGEQGEPLFFVQIARASDG
jgi:hypothetical protein